MQQAFPVAALAAALLSGCGSSERDGAAVVPSHTPAPQHPPLDECKAQYESFLRSHPDKTRSDPGRDAFCQAIKTVAANNKKTKGQVSGVKLALNKFADFGPKEMEKMYGGPASGASPVTSNSSMDDFKPAKTAPPNGFPLGVDWRSCMPPVKDQGLCSSDWIFAAIAVVDQYGGGPHSEQQVLDCYAPNGCATVAQTPTNALNYLLTAGSTEAGAYEYNHVQPTQGTCHNYPPSQHVTNVLKVGASVFSMEQVLQEVVIATSFTPPPNFGLYSKGVFTLAECAGGAGPQHAVAIVGYHNEKTGSIKPNYWIVRNSFGKDWGVGGYFYIEKGVGAKGVGACGIEAGAVTVTVQDDLSECAGSVETDDNAQMI